MKMLLRPLSILVLTTQKQGKLYGTQDFEPGKKRKRDSVKRGYQKRKK